MRVPKKKKKKKVCTNVKQTNGIVTGVNLWNDFKTEMKQCKTLHMFKATFRNDAVSKHEAEL